MQRNLEQIHLFVSVTEHQSFSAAARGLKRVQSAISSGTALLEADLGVTLFKRSSGRQPRLTDEDRASLTEAHEVLRQCERPQGYALSLTRDEEPRLCLAQGEAMPYQPMLDSLEALMQRSPSLGAQVSNDDQGDVTHCLLKEQADLGLLLHCERMPESLEWQRLGSVEMITVCGAGHPLAGLQWVSRRGLVQHRQLLIVPQQSGYPGGEQISPQVWRLDSFHSMTELLMCNLGWTWLPQHVVQYPTYDWLIVGLISDWTPPSLAVELVRWRNEALGPTAAQLGETFTRHLHVIG